MRPSLLLSGVLVLLAVPAGAQVAKPADAHVSVYLLGPPGAPFSMLIGRLAAPPAPPAKARALPLPTPELLDDTIVLVRGTLTSGPVPYRGPTLGPRGARRIWLPRPDRFGATVSGIVWDPAEPDGFRIQGPSFLPPQPTSRKPMIR